AARRRRSFSAIDEYTLTTGCAHAPPQSTASNSSSAARLMQRHCARSVARVATPLPEAAGLRPGAKAVNKKARSPCGSGFFTVYGLAVTYFRVRNAPSAQARFTVLFGMGRRGSRLLWPPDGRKRSCACSIRTFRPIRCSTRSRAAMGRRESLGRRGVQDERPVEAGEAVDRDVDVDPRELPAPCHQSAVEPIRGPAVGLGQVQHHAVLAGRLLPHDLIRAEARELPVRRRIR